MKKFFQISILVSGLLAGFRIYPGEFADLKTKISAARDSAVLLIQNPEKRGEDQQKLVKKTAEDVSQAIEKIRPSKNQEKKYLELRQTWADFKKLREEEIIPLVLSGNQEKALALANGINKQRLLKLYELCDELEK